MGLFDQEFIVEFEYGNGLFWSKDKSKISITESSEYSAKKKAKEILERKYKYVNILSVYSKHDRERKIREEKLEYEREQREYERQQRELERERDRVESERHALEVERKRLEYERWYSSLTPAQRKAEDEKKKKEEEERRIRLEEEKARLEEERARLEEERIEHEKKRKRIRLTVLLSIVVGILLLIGVIEIINSTKNYRYAYRELKKYDDETYEIIDNINQTILDYYIYADDRNNLYAQITCDFNDDSFGYQHLGAYIVIKKGKVKDTISVSLTKDKNKKYTIDASIKFYGISFEKYPTISFTRFEIEKGNLTNEQINFCKTLVLELYNQTNDFFILANPKKPLFPQ